MFFICVPKDDLNCIWGYGSTRKEARLDANKWIKEYYGDYDHEYNFRPNLNTDLVVYETSEDLHAYILSPENISNEYVPLEIIKGKAVLTEEAKNGMFKNELCKILDQAKEAIFALIQNSKITSQK